MWSSLETSVAPPAGHRVAQVYASALPVAYSAGIKAEAFEPFARLILRGAYEATLAVGQLWLLSSARVRARLLRRR